jgi:hypothetical protein
MISRHDGSKVLFLREAEYGSRPVGKQWQIWLQEENCGERLSFSDGLALSNTDGQTLVQPVFASHSMTRPLPKL